MCAQAWDCTCSELACLDNFKLSKPNLAASAGHKADIGGERGG